MKQVFLGIGGNIGSVEETMDAAKREIEGLLGVSHVVCSRFFRTSPVSDIPQDDFLNCVIGCQVTLTPDVFFRELCAIEKALGKLPKRKNAPRKIDIDILLFGDLYVDDGILLIPHPEWQNRLFVMQPLLDLVETVDVPRRTGCVETVSVRKEVARLRKIGSEHVEPVTICEVSYARRTHC